jgi:putative spermidine/putrescine transport system permease protein
MTRIWAWGVVLFGAVFFALPLFGMAEFSLSMRRGVYSLDAYWVVLADPKFQETFSYSVVMALFTIAFGVLLVVPTAYWVRLKIPAARPWVEFVTLLPLLFGHLFGRLAQALESGLGLLG